MTPAELLALAQRLLYGCRDPVTGERLYAGLPAEAIVEDVEEAARYLRACAEAEPVAWLEGPYGEFRANPGYRIAAPQSVAWSIPLYAGTPEQHTHTQRSGK